MFRQWRRQIWIFACLLILSSSLRAQGILVSLHCHDCPLPTALDSLSRQYALRFAYDASRLAALRSQVQAVDQPLVRVLQQLLQPHGLQAEQIRPGQYAIVSARDQGTTLAQRTSRSRQLTGQVLQADNQAPLPFASIRLSNGQGTYTDAEGHFQLIIQPPYPDSLRVSYLGFAPQTLAIPATGALQLALAAAPTLLEDVIITDGARQTLSVQDGGGEIRIDPSKLHLLSGLGESDLLRGIQLLPGLSPAHERATGLYVRGGTPAENLVLFDGITVYQPGHFFGLLSAFNAQAVKDVKLYRSGVGARYGGRTSAVIDITGRPGRVQQPRAGAAVNLMNVQAYTEVPWQEDRGGLLIAARRSFTDVAPSVLFQRLFDNRFQEGVIYFYGQRSQQEQAQTMVMPALHYFDVNAKWTYRPNDRDLFSVTALKSGDELTYGLGTHNNGGPALQTEDQLRLVNEGAASTYARQWNTDHYSRANLAISSYRNRYQYSYYLADDQFSYRSDLRRTQQVLDGTLRLEHNWTPALGWRLSGGWHATRLDLRTSQSLDDWQAPLVAARDTGRAQVQAVFGELVIDRASWGLEGGWRQHWFGGASYAEPRLRMYWSPARHWTLQANGGRYHQFLNFASVYNGLEAGEEYWALADGDSIPVLRTDLAGASLAYETEGYLLQVEAYAKRQAGIVGYAPRYNPNLNETDPGERLINGSGRVIGLELLLQRRQGAYTGWLSYTYSRVWQRFPGSDEGQFVAAPHDRPHQLAVVNQYEWGNWAFALNWIFANGLPITPATEVAITELPNGAQLYSLEFGPRSSERLPLYHRLDATSTYSLPLPQGTLRLGISIFNAYGRRNIGNRVFAVERPEISGQPANLLILDKPLLGFTPNVFLSWDW